MMPLSICLGSARLRPLTFGGSASKMIGPMSSQSSSGASHMVSKPSWLFTKFLQMSLEKLYESPHKPLKAFVRYDFEIVSKPCWLPPAPWKMKMATIFPSIVECWRGPETGFLPRIGVRGRLSAGMTDGGGTQAVFRGMTVRGLSWISHRVRTHTTELQGRQGQETGWIVPAGFPTAQPSRRSPRCRPAPWAPPRT